jgi:hypothetical protein
MSTPDQSRAIAVWLGSDQFSALPRDTRIETRQRIASAPDPWEALTEQERKQVEEYKP